MCAIFPDQRLYGYWVANVKEKIIQVTTCSQTGKVNEQLRSELMQRYHRVMDELRKLGYDDKVHPYLIEYLVNTYGIMKERTTIHTEDMSPVDDPQVLRKMITEYMFSDKVQDILILLNCLAYLAKKKGSYIFIC
ncbi:speriolin-like protein [Eleutherodactylus coqui]|uniref:speriolin-like protein n=1 Tax=Eleutherodactylus coqui TaxID=57060 RepID=UPI0034636FBD